MLYLFLAHMDIGYWIHLFQIHYLRAKGLSGYIISWIISLDYSQVVYWNYLLLYGRLLLLEDEAYITTSGYNIYWMLLR